MFVFHVSVNANTGLCWLHFLFVCICPFFMLTEASMRTITASRVMSVYVSSFLFCPSASLRFFGTLINYECILHVSASNPALYRNMCCVVRLTTLFQTNTGRALIEVMKVHPLCRGCRPPSSRPMSRSSLWPLFCMSFLFFSLISY